MFHATPSFRDAIRYLFGALPDFSDWSRARVTWRRLLVVPAELRARRSRIDRVLRRAARASAALRRHRLLEPFRLLVSEA